MLNVIRHINVFVFATACVLFLNASYGQAQRFVVGFPPGGTTDIVARVIAQKISELGGRTIIIDNRPGASSVIGIEFVRSTNDGKTFGILTTSGVIQAAQNNPKLLDGLTGVSLLGISGFAIVASVSSGLASIEQLRANTSALLVGSPGAGSPVDLCAAQFVGAAKLSNARIIQYKGTGAVLNDLLGGQIQLSCLDIGIVKDHIAQGRLRALATSLHYPHPWLPGVPTLESVGVANVSPGNWFAIVAPREMNKATVDAMSGFVRKALSDVAITSRLESLGLDPIPAEDATAEIAERFLQKQIGQVVGGKR